MSNLDSKQPRIQKNHMTGFGVAASPFNGVKLELGIVLCLGIILWLAADFITASLGTQLLIFVGYGLASAFWLVVRTRRVLRQCELNSDK